MKPRILLPFGIVSIGTIVIVGVLYLLSGGQCSGFAWLPAYHCSILEFSFPLLLFGVPFIAFPAFLILLMLFNRSSNLVFNVVLGICLILVIIMSYFSLLNFI